MTEKESKTESRKSNLLYLSNYPKINNEVSKHTWASIQ